ncbi:hypothetical protein ACH6EH_06765 [Paenibacillus sp. JSM ZJ436]|uniref:hypothetical protein n=1 Tax=Paenibacillus sp. JSM ZJ436 TaxID=3376190 RepID=UPI00378D62F9
MDIIGKKVFVKELKEIGVIVSTKVNIIGKMVYRVKTDNFDGWACYTHEMKFI